jgi:hypothetical protein
MQSETGSEGSVGGVFASFLCEEQEMFLSLFLRPTPVYALSLLKLSKNKQQKQKQKQKRRFSGSH